MADIELRAMRVDDIAVARALWKTSAGIGLRPLDDSQDSLQRFLESNPGLSFVALEREVLAGVVLCGTDGRRGYLHHLAVRSDIRRRGIGRQLVEQVIQALRDAGVSKASIDVFSDNPDAIAFWRRVGFFDRPDVRRMSLIVDS